MCIGVPYGTHIWQVGDASQLNGAFKMALYVAKRQYFQLLSTRFNSYGFSPTDIIPLVNTAWDKSFGRCAEARRAIIQRGWNPLNYVLLDHPKLKSITKKPPSNLSTELNTNSTAMITNSSSGITTVELNTSGPAVYEAFSLLVTAQQLDQGRI
jgi:hypothetical protein